MFAPDYCQCRGFQTMYSLTPNLMVEDIESTISWYERVFDAEVVATLPSDDGEYWWAQVMLGDAPLMFQEREPLSEKLSPLAGADIGGSIALYIDIDDADGLHEEVAAAGVDVVKRPHDTDFGWRQFAVQDPSGYVLWFGEQAEDEQGEEIGKGQRLYQDQLVGTVAAKQEQEHDTNHVPGGNGPR